MAVRVGIVVPHIFMQDAILPHVIFSPGHLARSLADGLVDLGAEVTLFTPGPLHSKARSVVADASLFNAELQARGDTPLELLQKHPLTFISMARQLQAELIAMAFEVANADGLDVVHIYTNEEETALPFAGLCRKPVVFTHHDPFNFQARYRSVFPKYPKLNWLSVSLAQRAGMPPATNWVANIYHGLEASLYKPNYGQRENYVVFMGRIIEPKGLHLAIAAVEAYNQAASQPLQLKIAGKHYAGASKDSYWQKHIEPQLSQPFIDYLGYVRDVRAKQALLGKARGLLMPSLFDEPFGMVMIEALACGTPIVGLDNGAIGEVVKDGLTGFLVPKSSSETKITACIAQKLGSLDEIDPNLCRQDFEGRFTLDRMCREHLAVYEKLAR